MKKQKAEKKRKAQAEKLQRRIEKKNSETSGALDDMIAYVDEFGNILDEKPEEPKEVKKELKEEKKKE